MDGQVTWYSLTVVPEAYVRERSSDMVNSMRIMLAYVFGILAFSAVLIMMSYAAQRRRLNRLAYEDPLTRGANYACFVHELERAKVQSGWMISMDITGYKNVNLALGHQRGDEMLKSIWKLIRSGMYKGDYACRVRDDHFAIYLTHCDREQLLARIHMITEQIDRLFAGCHVPALRPCFGIMEVKPGEPLEDAHTKAKIAREFIKGRKSPSYAFFTDKDYERVMEEQQIQDHMSEARIGHCFEAWYQPKYNSATERLVGAEALARWRNEKGELVTPGRFIPMLEKNGTISQLDEYMFSAVCRQQNVWRGQGLPSLPVSVNLSRASTYKTDVVKRYAGILRSFELDPRQVQIEITETALTGNEYVSTVLADFKQHGFKVLMDDFGSGYSNLAQLNTDSFDTIKLDKRLIDRIGQEDGDTLLDAVVRLGHRMGLSITAEGVERSEQASYLRSIQCDDIQGYYYGQPMPADEYEKLLMMSRTVAD